MSRQSKSQWLPQSRPQSASIGRHEWRRRPHLKAHHLIRETTFRPHSDRSQRWVRPPLNRSMVWFVVRLTLQVMSGLIAKLISSIVVTFFWFNDLTMNWINRALNLLIASVVGSTSALSLPSTDVSSTASATTSTSTSVTSSATASPSWWWVLHSIGLPWLPFMRSHSMNLNIYILSQVRNLGRINLLSWMIYDLSFISVTEICCTELNNVCQSHLFIIYSIMLNFNVSFSVFLWVRKYTTWDKLYGQFYFHSLQKQFDLLEIINNWNLA